MAIRIWLGDKNLSSWSLRPWLALVQTGATFSEEVVTLDRPDTGARIRAVSPGGRVPALEHDGLVVWESLAICEYLADVFPGTRLWPEDRAARAVARAVSSEMHAGFAALRREWPMKVAERHPGTPLSEDGRTDAERIVALWKDARRRFGKEGPFLFGRFSNADAMYAPVVTRFVTYGLDVDAPTRDYMDAVLALPGMRRWADAAKAEIDAR